MCGHWDAARQCTAGESSAEGSPPPAVHRRGAVRVAQTTQAQNGGGADRTDRRPSAWQTLSGGGLQLQREEPE